MNCRVGLGIDQHRMLPGRRCVLGGVEIDCPVGPAGHSDGDAVLHAVTDALLGAAGSEDLGTLFPDRDPANAGRSSREFLAEAHHRLAAQGLEVCSLDLVIECDRPRIAPHRSRIRKAIADALGVDPARVNVKGKTLEGVAPGPEIVRATAVVLVGPSQA